MRVYEQICISHIGNRPNHEDNFLFGGKYITPTEQKAMTEKRSVCRTEKTTSNVRFFAVSDGMGGHNAGEIASLICVTRLAELESTVQNCGSITDVVRLCQKAISEINNEVCAKSNEKSSLKGMGATLVLLVMCGSECAMLNIGDSRAYLFDGLNLTKITKDNTEGQRMLDLKLLSPGEIEKFPARKNLNRYIGFNEPGVQLTADEYFLNLQSEVILLCSDGVSDSLTDDEIKEYLLADPNVEIAANKMINRAIAEDGSDNATAIVVSIKEGF